MAWINICGFETQSGDETSSIVGTGSVQSSVARNGGHAFRSNPTTTAVGHVVTSWILDSGKFASPADGSPSSATSYCRFYFRYAVKPSSNSEPFFELRGNGYSAEIRIGSDGKLSFWNATTQLGSTGALVLTADTWYRIEIKIIAGATADWEIKINGTTEISGSDSLANSANTSAWKCGKAVNRNGNTVDFFYDDISIRDDDWPGEGQIVLLRPRANGTYFAQWTNGAGAGNYTDLRELPSNDGDTSYYTTSTQNHVLSVLVDSSATAGVSGTINCVKTLVIGSDVTNTVNNQIGMRSNGSDDYTTDFDYAAAYIARAKLYPQANGPTAWTTTLLDAVEPLHKHTQGQSRVLKCTWMGVMVDYTPDSGPSTYTADIAASTAAITGAISAEHDAPAFDADIITSTAAIIGTLAATFAITYTGDIAASTAAIETELAAEFSPGTKTASITATTAAITTEIVATFDAGTFTADIAASTSAITAVLAAEFDAPVYTATIAASTAAITGELDATFAPGTKTASIVASTSPIIGEIEASFDAGTKTASIMASTSAITTEIAATFEPGTKTATIAASTAAITAAISATFTAPVFDAEIDTAAAAIIASIAATFATETFTAEIVASTSPITGTLAASFDSGTFTADIAASTAAIVGELAATFAPGTKTASIEASTVAITGALAAAFEPGTKTASIVASTSPITAAIAATFEPGTKTADIAAATAAITASLSAEFDAPIFDAEIAASTSAITGSLSATFATVVFVAEIAASTGAITAELLATFAPVTLSRTQGNFRIRNDDGDEETATWLADENTNTSIAKETRFRLRIQTDVTGDAPSEGTRLQYRKVGDDAWRDVLNP